jgi:hypothetical protein
MQNTTDPQPHKGDATDLSYLYDFISQCPNPLITTAMRKLVDSWLEHADAVPHFSEELKQRLNMTDDEVVEMCWLLAVNPKTPPSVLNDLCSGASDGLLERIAENSNTGPTTLAQLSYQAVAEIRIATASNPTTPLASIMLLVEDDNPDVRFSIAENPNVPTKALEILGRDDNPYVKMRAELTLLRADINKNVFNKGPDRGEPDQATS